MCSGTVSKNLEADESNILRLSLSLAIPALLSRHISPRCTADSIAISPIGLRVVLSRTFRRLENPRQSGPSEMRGLSGAPHILFDLILFPLAYGSDLYEDEMLYECDHAWKTGC